MVDRLHRRDDADQLRIVVVDVLDEFGLGVRRAGDENRAGVSDGLRNAMKKILILRGVPAADGIRLVMDMPSRVVGMQHELVDSRQPEMEYARLAVIDPDDSDWPSIAPVIAIQTMIADLHDEWREPAFSLQSG